MTDLTWGSECFVDACHGERNCTHVPAVLSAMSLPIYYIMIMKTAIDRVGLRQVPGQLNLFHKHKKVPVPLRLSKDTLLECTLYCGAEQWVHHLVAVRPLGVT